MTQKQRPAERAGRAIAPAADHDEYECPGCRELTEYRIVADVYGCDAGRHCVEATPEQRIQFEAMIAERLNAWRQTIQAH